MRHCATSWAEAAQVFVLSGPHQLRKEPRIIDVRNAIELQEFCTASLILEKRKMPHWPSFGYEAVFGGVCKRCHADRVPGA